MRKYEITLNGIHKIEVEAESAELALDMAELELEDYLTDDVDNWTVKTRIR